MSRVPRSRIRFRLPRREEIDHYILLTVVTGATIVMGVMIYYDIGPGENNFAKMQIGAVYTGDMNRNWEEIRRAMPATRDRPAGPYGRLPTDKTAEEEKEEEERERRVHEAYQAALEEARKEAEDKEDEDDEVAHVLESAVATPKADKKSSKA